MARAVPSKDEEGENTEDMDEGGVHPPRVGRHQATGTPPTEGDDEGEDEGENGGDNEPGNLKAWWQLALFGPAAPVVERVVQKLQVEMAVVCRFLEFVKSVKDPHCTYFDLWMPKLWAKANDEIRHLIKSYEFNNPKVANLKADEDADSYRMYMRMMQEVVQVNPGALTNIQSKITLWCLKFRPQPVALPVVQLKIGAEQEVDHKTMLEIKAILAVS
ncbi:hypothetical protein FRC06_003453 [Ceratobasidium sp. 370]|nr:hypothetical protein FRC06_003453 [Ceratobasidium sp. 370]